MREIVKSILEAMFDRLSAEIQDGVRLSDSISVNFENVDPKRSNRDGYANGVVEMTCAAVQTVRAVNDHVHYSMPEYREIIFPVAIQFVHDRLAQLAEDVEADSRFPNIENILNELLGQKHKIHKFSDGEKVRLKKDHYQDIDDESTRIPAGSVGFIEGIGPHYAMVRMQEVFPYLGHSQNCIVWDDKDAPLDVQMTADLEPVLKFKDGDKVRLKNDVDRFPHFIVSSGNTGTVCGYEPGNCICVKIDQKIPALDEWDNQIIYSTNTGDLQEQMEEELEIINAELHAKRLIVAEKEWTSQKSEIGYANVDEGWSVEITGNTYVRYFELHNLNGGEPIPGSFSIKFDPGLDAVDYTGLQ